HPDVRPRPLEPGAPRRATARADHPSRAASRPPQDDGESEPGIIVRFAGEEKSHRLVWSWKPGDALWSGSYDGRAIAVQMRPALNGFDLAHRGVEVRALAYTEREAAAARLMPVKRLADSGKALRCPMPGVVRAIAVTEGQEVKVGETLAVVEAMKMENVLRAERDGVVKSIKERRGSGRGVGAVIMEFRCLVQQGRRAGRGTGGGARGFSPPPWGGGVGSRKAAGRVRGALRTKARVDPPHPPRSRFAF